MRRILLALCAVVALAAAGCGGNDNSSSSSSDASSATSTSTASSSSGGGVVAITMKGFQFKPKDATVKVGQKVKWTNEDTADHNVTASNDDDLKSKDFGEGGTFEYTADKAETIKYSCTIHPAMTATLTVTK
jgi:plastocyanin